MSDESSSGTFGKELWAAVGVAVTGAIGLLMAAFKHWSKQREKRDALAASERKRRIENEQADEKAKAAFIERHMDRLEGMLDRQEADNIARIELKDAEIEALRKELNEVRTKLAMNEKRSD